MQKAQFASFLIGPILQLAVEGELDFFIME